MRAEGDDGSEKRVLGESRVGGMKKPLESRKIGRRFPISCDSRISCDSQLPELDDLGGLGNIRDAWQPVLEAIGTVGRETF
jgi:hypothetical protein